MNKSDSVKRRVVFYLSVALFILLLPIVLSYSLGSHVDFRNFRIYQTGIIYLNSSPANASVYINGKPHPSTTPTQIEELKPGPYRVEVRKAGFYPWEQEVVVRPKMVTRHDRIVLFPVIQEMKRVSDIDLSDFAVSDRSLIYYLTDSGFFRSNLDGTGLKKLSGHSSWPGEIIGKKFSPDGNKFLFYSEWTVGIVYLNLEKALTKNAEEARVEEVFTGHSSIKEVFWYSASNYVLVVTKSDVKVVELRGGKARNIVSLYQFNAPPQGLYYDAYNDSLYFTDIEEGPGARGSSHLYRLDLRQKFFDQLMYRLLKREIEPDDETRQNL